MTFQEIAEALSRHVKSIYDNNFLGGLPMEIWVRLIWVSMDADDLTRGREYRVLGFNEGQPVVLDDANEFRTLSYGENVEYIVVSVNVPTKREPEL